MNDIQQISKERFERRGSGERISKTNVHDTGINLKKPVNQKLRLVLLALMAVLGATSVSPATAACTYSISPASRTHGHGAATNMVSVTASSNVCAWSVVNTNTWITITSATNGVGNGTVNYTVAANPSLIARTGVVVIAQQFFTMQQQGVPCTYSISPTSRTHGYGAASNTVGVTTSSGCTWTVINTNGWITITSAISGAGDGTVYYTVAANPSPVARTGVVVIAQQLFTVQQQGVPCTYSISPTSRVHGYGAASNSVNATTSSGCAWTVVNTNAWITITSATSGTGDGTVYYTVAANPNPTERTGVVVMAQQVFTVRQQPVICSYSISPTARVHGYGAASNTISVTTSSGCAWPVVNTNAWITITSATSGTGDGTITYEVAANPSASDRMGVVMIADQPFSVTQRAAPCTVSISPDSRTHGYGATNASVSVTTAIGCPWTVINTNDWITITSATSASGSGNVTYMVEANPNPMERTGVVMIADQPLTLTQRAVVCAYDISPTTRFHGFGETTGTVTVVPKGSGCSWTVVNTNTWITILSSTQGMGFGSVGYKVAFNHSTNERSGVIRIADQALFLTQRGLTNTGFFFQSITLLSGGQVKLRVLGPTNSTCELQASLDLINWERIFSATNTTGSVEYIDTPPSSVKRRLYRALLR
jgi:hypothetical protein